MKFVKALLFIIATTIMALTLFFIPESSGPVSISFTTVLGLYLGLDMASMIQKSTTLAKGDYANVHIYKYIVSAVCLGVLVIISVFLKDSCDLSTALTSFITSSMIILGCLIGGLEGNKIAARVDGESDVEVNSNT